VLNLIFYSLGWVQIVEIIIEIYSQIIVVIVSGGISSGENTYIFRLFWRNLEMFKAIIVFDGINRAVFKITI
jgi:hypothetical protein